MRKSSFLKKLVLFILVVFLLFTLYITFLRASSYFQLQGELRRAEEEKKELTEKNEELLRAYIQSDSDFTMEKLAREKLGMAKPDETVYRLQETSTPTISPAQEPNFWERLWQGILSFLRGIVR